MRPISVKSILKEMLERNKYYGDLSCGDPSKEPTQLQKVETMNHQNIIELCNLLGVEDLYDDHEHQEYVSQQADKIVRLIHKELGKAYKELTTELDTDMKN